MERNDLYLSLDIAIELIAFCSEPCVPYGFNIHSVAIRKDEIETSIQTRNQ